MGRSVRLPVDRIWTPDIIPYDARSKPFVDTRAVIYSSGTVTYLPPTDITVKCSKFNNDAWFENTMYSCKIKYGSWTYSGDKVDIELNSDYIDLSTYQLNEHYELVNTTAVKNVQVYDCCPEP